MRLLLVVPALVLAACGTTAHIGRVDVAYDANKNITSISSPILLLGTSPDELVTVTFRCSKAQCGANDRVTAVIEADSLILGRPEEALLVVGEWRYPLKVTRYQAWPMEVGYRHQIEAEVSLGMLMKIAAEEGSRIEVLTLNGAILPEHREPIEDFVQEVIDTRENHRAIAAL